MKRIVRERRLTPEEAAHYNKIRDQVEQDLPDLIARHRERTDQVIPALGPLPPKTDRPGRRKKRS